MDQLKPILENAYKYRFWIICGVVLTLSLVFSFMTASSMRAETKAQKTAIESSYNLAGQLGSKPDPPNDASHKAMQAKIDEVKEGVRQAWQTQYDNQNEGPNKLVWPSELGDEFIKVVTAERFHPIERISTDQNDAILEFYRISYRDYIKRELPKLAAIIGAEWQPKGNSLADDKEREEDGKKFIVEWNPSNQSYLENSRFDWTSNPNSTPTTLEVFYSQEDLWVLRTILQVIKDTNGPVQARYKAAIKRIDSILLGQDVTLMADSAVLKTPGSNAGGGDSTGGNQNESMSMSMEGDGTGTMMDSGGGGGAAGGGAAGGGAGGYGTPLKGAATDSRKDPAHLRYVNNDFRGVPASMVRGALTSNEADKALYAVAKRIPIRMQLSIDQRRLNKFLTLCGNAPLQIEVERVRVNKKSSANPTAGGGGGGGGEMDMMSESDGLGDDGSSSYGTTGGEGMGSDMMSQGFGQGGSVKVTKLADESPFDIDVEIYAMVYIYNPVDLDRLGIDPPKPVAPEPSAPVQPGEATDDNNQNAAALAAPENPQAG